MSASAHAESKPKKITVQLKWNHQFQFAGFYAAVKKGYYRDQGLTVSLKSWQPEMNVIKKVIDGEAEFGVFYGSSIIEYAKGAPIKLVLTSFQYSPSVLLSHEPVSELSQLAGKKVMNTGNLQVEALIKKAEKETESTITVVPSSGNLESFINHDVDLYSAYFTNEPIRLKKNDIPFYVVDPKSYGIQSYGDFVVTSQQFAELNPDLVQKFKQATIKGWEYAINNHEEIVDYIIANYPTVKSRDDMLAEAKATDNYFKTAGLPIGEVTIVKLMETAVQAKDLGLMTESELEKLDLNQFVFNHDGRRFTRSEVAYLEKYPVIRVANDIAWQPIEYIDEKGLFKGIVSDYLALFEKRLGVKFEPVKTHVWPEVLQMAERGELDIFSSTVKTPERSRYMRFTDPYLSFPMVLAALKSVSYIDHYGQMSGKTVAVLKGYWSYEYLKQSYPQIKLLLVDSVKEGLDAVLEGRAFAYSGNLAAINYATQKNGMTDIHIVGQAASRYDLAIGVQRDNPILFNILRKALASVTEEEKQEIYNRWIRLEIVKKTDNKVLFQLLSVAGIIILILIILSVIYRYQKSKQDYYIHQIHELSYAVTIDAKTLNILWVSQSFCDLTGYSKKELLGQSYLKTLAYRIKSPEEIKQIREKVMSGQVWKGEIEGHKKSGEPYWVQITFTPEKDFFGKVVRILSTRVDVTDKKRVELLSITDELTGLFNRRYYNDVIEREVSRTRRSRSKLSVIMIDIDHFKKINDTYGHHNGDEVLKQLASLIRSHFTRGDDFVFRVGGEEFLVLSSGFDEERLLQQYLNELRQLIESLGIENRDSQFGVVTISIGAGLFEGEEMSSADKMYQQVDERLYLAKESGRNQVVMR